MFEPNTDALIATFKQPFRKIREQKWGKTQDKQWAKCIWTWLMEPFFLAEMAQKGSKLWLTGMNPKSKTFEKHLKRKTSRELLLKIVLISERW